MKVLHVGKFYPPHAGGIERFNADLAEAQVRAGHEVTVLCHQKPGQAGKQVQREGVHVCRVRTLGQLLYVPLSPAFPLALGRLVRSQRPDVIHLHLPNPAACWALLSPAARRVPWVLHWHADVVASRIDRRLIAAYSLYRPLEQALCRRAAIIIATSQTYLDASEPLRRWRDKVQVVPLGLDGRRLAEPTEPSLAWARQQWPADAFRLLMVGRLTYYKGHSVLWDALERTDSACVCVVGEGGLERPLRQRAESETLRRKVAMLGGCDDQQLRSLLATCDALVLPSVERTEAFGLVLLEAMACGKPVIISDLAGSGMTEVVEAERTGLTFTTGDAAGLAHAIERLAGDRQLAAAMGRRGRQRFAEHFEIDNVRQAIDGVYEKLIDRA